MLDIRKIDLGKISRELRPHENEWVAISEENRIVASGRTYADAVGRVADADKVVLLKVPPVDASLAPASP